MHSCFHFVLKVEPREGDGSQAPRMDVKCVQLWSFPGIGLSS